MPIVLDGSNGITQAEQFNSDSTFGFKNRIINGAMVIDQRNAGASGTANGYTVDRWQFNASLTTKGTWQQNAGAVTPPVGFINYLGFTSNSAYSVPAGELFTFQQRIEGFNTADLAWGTASASTVTLSFWVYSSLTGTFGGTLRNSAGNRSYPFSYTISSANTWEQKSITIAGDTTGTWLTTNGIGIIVTLSLGTGSTFSGTAGSWSANNFTSSTGATSVVGTSGATFYITGVQLEVGSTATSFDYRPYTTELQLCQRYYENSGTDINSISMFNGRTVTGSVYWTISQFKVEKRAAPTIVLTNQTNSGFGTTTGVEGSTTKGYREARTATSTADAGYYFSSWTASIEL
jgi:hypothetical protein